jgi:hypothetical protein
VADEVIRRDVNSITLLGAITNNVAQEIKQLRVDSITNRLLVDATTAVAGCDTIGDGTTTLVTAGVPVQLPDVACKRAFIVAHESNAGTIVVGASTVVAALSGRRGRSLFASQGDWFNVSNLNLLYIDSTSSGDIIHFYWEL